MSETAVIKSFLVSLGFKQDEAALAKFEGGIDKATTAVMRLATIVSASAVTVAIGVERFASNLEALYFASIRTGASATNLKAFARAAQDFGASASEAQGSVEGFARFLRNNPGGEGLLQSLGVQVRDPKTGKMRDTSDVLLDLGKAFGKMPTYRSNQYAGMFGISDNMMLAMRNGDFAADLEKVRHNLADAGFDKAAADAHKFEMQVRALKDNLWRFAIAAQDVMMNHFLPVLKQVISYLEIHGPSIAKQIGGGIETIVGWIEKSKPFFEGLYKQLVRLDEVTGGWSTKLIGVLALLRIVGGPGAIGGILSLAAAFVRVGAGLAGLGTGAAGVALAGLGGIAAAVGGGVALGWGIDKLWANGPLAKIGDWIGNTVYDATHQKEIAMQIMGGFGWSNAQSAGIVARLNEESGLSQGAIGDDGEAYGVAQWHADRQAAFKRWSGKDIHQSNMQEQLGFVNYEMRHGEDAGARRAGALISASTNAGDSADYFTRFYERPKDIEGQTARAREAAVHLSASTVVHIDGSRDVHATAQAVKAAQVGTVTEMTRNLQGSVQ